MGRAPPSELAAPQQPAQLLVARSVALDQLGVVQQGPELDQVRHPLVLVGEVGAARRIAEAQCPLTQVVADAEQEIGLSETSLSLFLASGAAPLLAPDQPPAPAIRGAVGEGAEGRAPLRRLLRTGNQRQHRVERVGIVASQIVRGIAEGRRLALAAPVQPGPPCEQILAGDLDDDLDLSHRRALRGSAAAPASAAAARSACDRHRLRTGREQRRASRRLRAHEGSAAGSPC